LRLDDFTKHNHNQIKNIINNKIKLTITEELKTYIEQQTKLKYLKPISSNIDLHEISYLLKNNIIIFEQLHQSFKNNTAIQKIAFLNNHLLYADLSDNLKLDDNIIEEAINKNQFHTQYIIDIKTNSSDILNILFKITSSYNQPIELNDFSKDNIKPIIRAFKNHLLEKQHLTPELFSYIIKNHKYELYTPRFIQEAKTKIPEIKYHNHFTFFEYLKIIIPIFLLSLVTTIGFIIFMNHYAEMVKDFIQLIFQIIGSIILIIIIFIIMIFSH
jgi:hypothetical protein